MNSRSGNERQAGRVAEILLCVAAAVVAGAFAPVQAEEELVVFTGTGSKTTGEFEVNGPWLLDWSVTGLAGTRGLGIEIILVESELLRYRGTVLNTYNPGAGTKMFKETGRLRFRVSSSFAGWRLKVSTITPEEARRMVPAR